MAHEHSLFQSNTPSSLTGSASITGLCKNLTHGQTRKGAVLVCALSCACGRDE